MSEQDTQVVDSINSTEELELETNQDDVSAVEDVDTLREMAQKAEEKARQILARAKKAEHELKQIKAVNTNLPPTQPNINNSAAGVQNSGVSQEDVQVMILKTQGLTDDLIDKLKVVAKLNGKSLIEAQTDPVFETLKAQKQKDDEAIKARLGASRGSGQVKKTKDFTTPGLSEAEHKAMWKASQAK